MKFYVHPQIALVKLNKKKTNDKCVMKVSYIAINSYLSLDARKLQFRLRENSFLSSGFPHGSKQLLQNLLVYFRNCFFFTRLKRKSKNPFFLSLITHLNRTTKIKQYLLHARTHLNSNRHMWRDCTAKNLFCVNSGKLGLCTARCIIKIAAQSHGTHFLVKVRFTTSGEESFKIG